MKRIFILAIIMLFNQPLIAQSGPEVTCTDCENYIKKTTPINGMWYNPEQSGSGYSIEVQNRKLFGAYYGYDEEGNSIWWTFVGDLVPSDDPEIMWTVDSDLSEFENGNCINCDYQPPAAINPVDTIHFDFKQKNYASVRFNDGSVQNIVPLVFGVTQTSEFPEYTTYKFPDLSGTWIFMFDVNADVEPGYPWQWGYFSYRFSISGKEVSYDANNNKIVSYNVTEYYGTESSIRLAEIECSIKTINDVQSPSCIFTNSDGVPSRPALGIYFDYTFSLGGLGAHRIFGESEDGHTFEAIRYDYTEFGEIPD